ncbi:MAG: DegT/DnrJ/EryC1/StrS family aminotransferase [Candidatus Hydrothermarchaeales archaeon]
MIPIASPQIGEEEKRAVEEVLESGIIAQGPKVREFEERFASYVGTRYGVTTSSGTTALHLALLACNIGKDDEVITTPFSFIATANSVLYCGARPVFVDIDEKTFNIDPKGVQERITKKTKAVLAVHLYGQSCEMDALLEICRDNGLKLIEDACQAHGATYKGKKVGGFGDAGVFSFYPTKNMTTGEGGMITTDNPEVAEKARLLREHGSKVRYHHEVLGYNYRMTDIAAAIGLVQLKKLDTFNMKRIENAKKLTEAVEGLHGLTPPYVMPEVEHVFHQYTIKVTKDFHIARDEVAKRLNEKGVGTVIYYPIPIHKQPLYQGKQNNINAAEAMAGEVLSLPVHHGLSNEDLEHVCKSILEL